ncbi:MAG: hypothetical protein LBL49_05545 [Clostridiales Family XIII bacterium]|jgi:hypothetical protein|nr:hypothetical protein [Clostridiales Family XIII bacterium]
MKNLYLRRVLAVLASLAAIAVFAVVSWTVYNDAQGAAITRDVDGMRERAASFWENKDYDNAIYQLTLYLQERPDDHEAWATFGEYHQSLSDEDKAMECYANAAFYASAVEDTVIPRYGEVTLTSAHRAAAVKDRFADYSIEISPAVKTTRDMQVTIARRNLTPPDTVQGRIFDDTYAMRDVEQFETTDWFAVSDAMEWLTMSGGFNCAVWQFRNGLGEIVEYVKHDETFREKNRNNHLNKHSATVRIPEGMGVTEARVTFLDRSKEEVSSMLDIPLSIVYGKIPVVSENETAVSMRIPDLPEGAVLRYEAGVWSVEGGGDDLIKGLGQIEIFQGDTISISGRLCGKMVVNGMTPEEVVRNGEYGVRWKQDNPDGSIERVGDAKGLNFNYMVGDELASQFANDFDLIYPWSEMRLCNIGRNGKILYEDEDDGFSRDGKNGDVMVEIPVHYVKREIKDGYEYIYISGTPRAGYTVDPSFVTTKAGILDNIYIGAYLSGVKNEQGREIRSISGEHPLINMSFNEITELAESKTGFGELDICTWMTLQRLFLVETAVLNSQSLFRGVTGANWGSSNSENTSAYALSSSEGRTNRIQLTRSASSEKYQVGEAVSIYDVPNHFAAEKWEFEIEEEIKYYDVFRRYENTDAWRRVITAVRDGGDGTLWLEFSGEPIKIQANMTMIQHLPPINGMTDDIQYHTGMTTAQDGMAPFKYRHIENLYTLCVFLDGIRITQHTGTVRYPDGREADLAYSLVSQAGTPSEGVLLSRSSALWMGYDPENPLIMLPASLGGTADGTAAYGDSWFYNGNATNAVLTCGLTWDLQSYAGLFAYRSASEGSAAVENGSRLIRRGS